MHDAHGLNFMTFDLDSIALALVDFGYQ